MIKKIPVLSLENAPDRSGVVGAAQVAAALGIFFLTPVIFSIGVGLGRNFVNESPLPVDFPVAQGLSYIAFFGGSLALWLWLCFQSRATALQLGLRGRGTARAWRVGLWGIPAGLVLVQGLVAASLCVWQWFGKEEPKVGHEVFRSMQEHPDAVGDMVVQGAVAIALAPLCEEALFRGLLQTGLQAWRPSGVALSTRMRWATVVAVGIAFGAVHVGAVPPPMLPGLVALGIFLGWSYEYTGCFWVPVAIHVGFNAVSFAAGVWQIRAAVQ